MADHLVLMNHRQLATLSRLQLCELLRVAPCTFDRMRSSGRFPVQLIGGVGHPRWSRAAVAKWLRGEPDMADEWFALLTMTEVAQALAVPRATAYRRLQQGALRESAVRLGSEIRYPATAVARLVSVALTKDPVGV